MNKIYRYIFVGFTALCLSSCSNDWLDLEPSTATTPGVKILSDAEFELNGIYSIMQDPYAYSGRLVYYGDVTGDDMQAAGKTKRVANYYLFNFTKDSAPSSHWSYLYAIIQNCNVILTHIDNIPISEDEKALRDDYKGQALAIRGMALFDLTRIFGYPYTMNNGASPGACIVTTVSDKNAKPARSTVAQCYDQVIKDLTESTQLLGESFNKGKFNKWAALTLLSRIYLYKGDNENAYKTAVEAINGAEKNDYKLWSNAEYATAWGNDASESNPGEVLFEIVNLTTDSPGKESLGYLNSPDGYDDECITVSFYHLLQQNPNDVRLKLVNIDRKHGIAYMNKYQPQQGENIADANIPLIRLSEAYLNAAEAAQKLGDNDDAIKYLDPIVKRADPDNTVAGTTVTLDRILTERRKELVGEGHRMFDLLRNGLKVKRVDEEDEVLSGTKHLSKYLEYGTEFYMIVLPIPTEEIHANPGIEQNKGW